jgi:hypothetical protein
MYVVIIDSATDGWTVNQSFEAEFSTLGEAESYVRTLERWSATDSQKQLWISHGPQFRIFCEESGEYV